MLRSRLAISIITCVVAVVPLGCGTAVTRESNSNAVYSEGVPSPIVSSNDEPNARIALISPGDVSTRSMNDYVAQCGEQARLTHHEIEDCRAITVLEVPLD